MPSDERSLPGGDDEESLLPDGRENALPMHPEDTLLVVATMDGVVHTVEGSSGALLWSFDSGGTLLSSSSLDRLLGSGANKKSIAAWMRSTGSPIMAARSAGFISRCPFGPALAMTQDQTANTSEPAPSMLPV